MTRELIIHKGEEIIDLLISNKSQIEMALIRIKRDNVGDVVWEVPKTRIFRWIKSYEGEMDGPLNIQFIGDVNITYVSKRDGNITCTANDGVSTPLEPRPSRWIIW